MHQLLLFHSFAYWLETAVTHYKNMQQARIENFDRFRSDLKSAKSTVMKGEKNIAHNAYAYGMCLLMQKRN